MPIKEAGVVHAKWCGHCKDLMPKWEEFSGENVKGGKYNGIQIHALEESTHKDLIEQKGIKVGGFPHFFSIDDKGKVESHDQVGRDKGGIKMWLDEITGGQEKTEKKEGFSIMGMFGGKKKRKTAKKAKKAKKVKKAKKTKRKTAKKSKKTKKRKLFGLF